MNATDPPNQNPAVRITRDSSARLIICAAFALALCCAVVYVMQPGVIAYCNFKWMDAIEQNVPAAGGRPVDSAPAVIVVNIDENDLLSYGQWPWPRYRLAELLESINQLGPASIALTFILAETDRTSLNTIQSEFKNNFGLTFEPPPWPPELLDNDALLARTLSKGPYVLAFKLLFDTQEAGVEKCTMHPLATLTIEKTPSSLPTDKMYRASHALTNLPQLNAAVTRSGHLNGTADVDGRLRRLPLVIQWDEAIYPTLALAAVLQTTPDATMTLRQDEIGRNYLELSDKIIPLDECGNAQIRFAGHNPRPRQIPAATILRGEADPADFEQAIVFVGLSAVGMDTFYAIPSGEALSAADIHARMAQTLLSGRFISRPNYMRSVEILIALVLSLLFGMCIARMEFMGITMVGIGGVVLLQSLSQLLFRQTGFLFSPLLPAGALLINWLTLMMYKFALNQRAARHQSQKAMQLVRDSEKELNSIMKSIPDIVFRLDPKGCITFISAAVRTYNKRPEDLISTPMLDLIVPEQRSATSRWITERRTGRRSSYDLETRLLLYPDGDDKEGRGRFFSLSTEGIYRKTKSGILEFIGTQGIARDVHQRKKLEKQLEQAKKMEAIGNLTAGVAHDLNNLLSGLVSYPELLLLELPQDSPLRDKIEIIRQSGQYAAAVVQDMLCIARHSIQDHDIVQINDVVHMFLSMPALHKLLQQHTPIRTEVHLADDLLNIKGSVVHLTKMILNLAHNAAEAMPAGGTITVETHNCYLEEELLAYEKIPAGEYVLLTVKDQGVGIPAEYLAHIFEPFFSKKKMGRSGSGLGMTVVWGTVKDHGGYMDLESREAHGTSFTIYLPATREEKAADQHRIVLEDYVGYEKILIVDDNRDQREIASNMLTRLGYQTAVAASGEEAVSYLQKHAVDLVLLDMIMPGGMDGLDTYRHIQPIRPGLKAVIVSGYSESRRIQSVLEMGAGAFVSKPYTLEKIGMAIRSVLGPNQPSETSR